MFKRRVVVDLKNICLLCGDRAGRHAESDWACPTGESGFSKTDFFLSPEEEAFNLRGWTQKRECANCGRIKHTCCSKRLENYCFFCCDKKRHKKQEPPKPIQVPIEVKPVITSSRSLKQVIIINTDLGMSIGKSCSQAAHAGTLIYEVNRADQEAALQWIASGMTTIVLGGTLKEITELEATLDKAGILAVMIMDEGRTEIPPGSITALGIGPIAKEKIDPFTKGFKLLKAVEK